MSLSRKFLAELIGTWMLVLVGPGAAAITLMLAQGENFASDFSIGISALGGLGDWLAIGLAFAFIIAAAIYIFGKISGAHINPAVTIALWATKRFPTAEVIPYLIAQLIGALFGSITLVLMLGTRASDIGGLGAPGAFPGVAIGQLFLAEAVGTFILMLVIMAVAVDERAPEGWAGLIIGLTVGGLIILLGNISGCSINPARAFGPIVGNAIFGNPGGLSLLWVFLAAPIVGSVIAAYVYDFICKPEN